MNPQHDVREGASGRAAGRPIDGVIEVLDRTLRALAGVACSSTPFPDPDDEGLGASDRRAIASMMRVNHAGEVCAQALYLGQALVARDPSLREFFLRSAEEESDHLAWMRTRLDELGERRSLFDPLWFLSSGAIAVLAGGIGDRANLAFLRETEVQVAEHLDGHLRRLPHSDQRSRAMIERMRDEELAHAMAAVRLGAPELSLPAKAAMRAAAQVMKTVAAIV